jgi:hypothetical protein
LLTINGVAPGKRNQVAVGARVNNAKEVGLYKVVVESAELAQ